MLVYAITSWNEQRKRVFLDRYALKNDKGELLEEIPEKMWDRVARRIANNVHEYDLFKDLMNGFKFVPSGRILSGAEAGQQVTYYSCFVIGVRSEDHTKGNDSRYGIMDTLTNMVEISSRGGGVGINWSMLRPSGAYIKGVHGQSSGANSWMRGADGLANQIRQGGSRTAAMMFMLDVWHPDILNFVNPEERFQKANFSVSVSDDFMDALWNDEEWPLIFPDISHEAYNTVWDGNINTWKNLGHPIVEYNRIPARKLWEMMCEGARRTGSPGVVFLDRCNKASNTWYLEELIATNPCGEQPLPANGSCNLGSVNLTAHWNPETRNLNWKELATTIRHAVRFLDNVIDKSIDINEDIANVQQKVRRVGLGTMGLADVLILKGLRYGSEESLEYLGEIYSFIRDNAYLTSVDLARDKGCAPGFDAEQYLKGEFIQRLPKDIQDQIAEHGIRNLQVISQAPTGTTSILAGVSSGIEPIFSPSYIRRDATGEHKVIHPLFNGVCGKHLVSVTGGQISIADHISVQAKVQEYVDSSISKTINLPSSATTGDIDSAYRMAYELGCKGITIYRSGSLEGDVMIEEDTGACEACSV